MEELLSLFPDLPRSQLVRALTAAGGDPALASNAILDHASSAPSSSKTAGLRGWLGIVPKPKKKRSMGVVKGNLGPSKKMAMGTSSAFERLGDGGSKETGEGTSSIGMSNAFERLKEAAPLASSSSASSSTKSVPTLELFSPEMILKETGGYCELIENVLPTSLGARLFLRMMNDASEWDKNRWFLFDRLVESPHSTSFYVEPDSPLVETAKHWYNGEERDAQVFTSEMNEARALIGTIVRSRLATRPRNALEFQGEWQPNVSACNRYADRSEGVGMHSDVLTYLGPRPTIASLSLGVERKFHLRSQSRTLSIALPHNSLLIMHAGTQEFFRHGIPPRGKREGMDAFKIPRALAGEFGEEVMGKRWTDRINITFRHYRPDFAINTPVCRCLGGDIPAALRYDAKGKVQARLFANGGSNGSSGNGTERLGEGGGTGENEVYFWMCNAGGQNEGKTCGFFEVLKMPR